MLYKKESEITMTIKSKTTKMDKVAAVLVSALIVFLYDEFRVLFLIRQNKYL